MTKYVVCAVMDSAVGAFGQPIFVPATAVAVRSFTDEVNRADAQNAMYAHPEDYALYRLGEWDNETGRLFSDDTQMLVRAKDVVMDKK